MKYNASIATPGFCNNSTEVTFKFGELFSLIISRDGSHEIRPHFSSESDAPIESRKSLFHKSHVETDEQLAGEYARTNYNGLGYYAPHVDAHTIQMANAEHAALHLWIDVMKTDDRIRMPQSIDNAMSLVLMRMQTEAAGITEGHIEDLFITAIQLLANGVQPDDELLEDIDRTSTLMDLAGGNAAMSALAFVSFFRSYVRNAFTRAD